MLIVSHLPEIFLGVLFAVLLISGMIEFRHAPRARLLLYFILRSGAILALYLMLARTGSFQWEKKRIPLQIILLRDVSDSMKILPEILQNEFDTAFQETRRALNAVPNAAVTELVFAAETASVGEKGKLSGASTALGDSLASLAHQYSTAQIFLVSDGRSNLGVHPAAAVAFLKNLGFTLHTLLPGRTEAEEYPSLVFGSVSIPDTFRVRQSSVFRATLLLSGLPDGRNATLRAEFLMDGKITGEIEKKADAAIVELQFTLDESRFPASGWHEFEIRVELQVAEFSPVTANYKDVFEIPSENAAMLLWNRMDPELNALLPFLRERYRPFYFAYVSLFAKQAAEEQLKRIDSLRLLMLGPVLPEALSGEVRKRIAHKLHDKTLTLLFLSPRVLNAWSRDPEIGVYVPAAAAAFTRLPDDTQYRFTENGTVRSIPFASVWRMTPKPSSVAKRLPGEWNGVPPLVLSSGNVTAFAWTDSWRWRISPDRALALAYIPFWTQMLESSDNFDESDLHFSIVRADPLLNDDLYRFTVEDYAKAMSGTDLQLLRRASDGKTMQRLFRFGPAEKRVSSAVLRITEPGIHWFQAEDTKTGRHSRQVPLVVRGNEKELQFNTPDLGTLQMLARLGGGSAIGRDAIRSVIGKLAGEAQKNTFIYSRKHQDSPMRFRLVCAMIAIVLLSGEWLLRKKESSHAE